MNPALVIATELPGSDGSVLAGAAATAVAATGLEPIRAGGRGVVVAELGGARRRGPTLLASSPARGLEQSLRAAGVDAAARGALCWVVLADDEELSMLSGLVPSAGDGAAAVIACLPPHRWRTALESERLRVVAGLLRAELPAQRSLAALAVRELHACGARARVMPRRPGAVGTRRALAGLDPGGVSGRWAQRTAAALLGPAPAQPIAPLPRRGAAEAADADGDEVRMAASIRDGERAQALPLVLGAAVAAVLSTLLLAALGGAITGTARAQRAADLAAVSAARAMRDDYERLFVPARLPDGAPNPSHLSRQRYLARASQAAGEAATANGADPARATVSFPDRRSFAPLRVRVELAADVDPELVADAEATSGRSARPAGQFEAVAEAALAPPAETTGVPTVASGEGGGYSGPLAHRQGKPMRPDVARAFDRLAAAARRAGVALVISSAYRSDAEQARLFARNPDPRWVAPPGRSLHRCGTELDLGPPAAYGWLAANAPRFGFVRRYAWEPWHFGYSRGPEPCAAQSRPEVGGKASRGPRRVPADGRSAGRSLPAYVPARFRAPIAAAAARHGVSAALLAAQLLAESNFNPFAVSPAGARGIAQFMPATAAAYGLRDPFDAARAIDAQARLVRDLHDQFGSVPLALAAYNAGPAPVAACSCVPPYPETQAYVARILGLLDGAGELVAPPLEVRLVA